MNDEQHSPECIDGLKGCRSGQNCIAIKDRKSGGTIMWSTCSGFILSLKSIKRTESPTEVWMHLIKTIWCNEDNMNLFNRMCGAVGYDFMCCMVKRLLSPKLTKLFYKGDKMVHLLVYTLIKNFGLERLFIDIFHSRTHKLTECKSGTLYIYKFDINNKYILYYILYIIYNIC